MRRAFSTALALVAVVAVAVAAEGTAGAHSDDGSIEIVSVRPTGPLTVRFDARITFVGDGHAAPAASATVVAEQAGGTVVGPIVLTIDEPGRYGATVVLPSPGAWTLRASSLSPTAFVERVETIAAVAPPTTTAAPSTTAPSPSSTSTTTTSASASATSTTVGNVAGEATPSLDEPDEDKVATTLAFAGVMLAIVVIAGLAVRSARKGRHGMGPT